MILDIVRHPALKYDIIFIKCITALCIISWTQSNEEQDPVSLFCSIFLINCCSHTMFSQYLCSAKKTTLPPCEESALMQHEEAHYLKSELKRACCSTDHVIAFLAISDREANV